MESVTAAVSLTCTHTSFSALLFQAMRIYTFFCQILKHIFLVLLSNHKETFGFICLDFEYVSWIFFLKPDTVTMISFVRLTALTTDILTMQLHHVCPGTVPLFFWVIHGHHCQLFSGGTSSVESNDPMKNYYRGLWIIYSNWNILSMSFSVLEAPEGRIHRDVQYKSSHLRLLA